MKLTEREIDISMGILCTELKDYKVFNNKVVVCCFTDQTIERAICAEEDSFCLETGISICILKHILGGSSRYNRIIKAIVKSHDRRIKAEENRKTIAEKEKLAKEKNKEKKARKRREKQIEIMKEALVRANEEIDNKNREVTSNI